MAHPLTDALKKIAMEIVCQRLEQESALYLCAKYECKTFEEVVKKLYQEELEKIWKN